MMPVVRTGPLAGLVVSLALLAAVAGTVGLGAVGWVAGLGYAIGLFASLTRAVHRAGATGLGPADRVTLTRAVIVTAITALVAESLRRPIPVGVLVTITIVALVLDGVDGR